MAHLFLNLDRSVPARFRGFRPRVAMVIALFVVAGMGLAARALQLQVLQHERLSNLAERQSRRVIRIGGKRGDILDRNGGRLAASIKSDSIRNGSISSSSLVFSARNRSTSKPNEMNW